MKKVGLSCMEGLLSGTRLAKLRAAPSKGARFYRNGIPPPTRPRPRMQTHRLILLATLFALQPLAAHAQATAPRDPDAAARAAREANNPLRVIIEASKLKSRATDAPPVRPVVAKPATPAPVAAKPQTAPVVAAKAPGVPAAVVAASQPAAEPAPIAAVATRTELAPVVLSVPAPVVPAPKPAPLLPLKLAQMVEPALPPAVLRRMVNDTEVIVGFTVNADGSVSNVAVRSSPLKALEAPVIDAISQWRYEPIGEARAHAVQLVLRAGR
ncbi:MAG: TonB family protein [Rhizobacter sp.]|nr:TonB family protein [Rhizobacter sp.]